MTNAIATCLLQKLSELYLEKHLRAHHTSGAYEFFKVQSDAYEKQMNELKIELEGLRERYGVVDLDEQKRLSLTKLAELEVARLKAEVEYRDSQSRAHVTRDVLRNTAPRIQSEVKTASNTYSIERLGTLIVELKNKRTQLLTKFHEDDRLVKEIDQQLRDTQMALDNAQGRKEVEEATGINPARPTLEHELAKLEAGTAGLRAQTERLTGELGGYRAKLLQLEEVTLPHKQLELRVKEAEDNYKLYAKKAEESRITDALDQQKFANVAVAESPVVPQLPYKPNRTLVLLLGLMLAALASVGIAFLAEFFDHTVHTPRELESFMGLPVFATLPELSLSERRRELIGSLAEPDRSLPTRGVSWFHQETTDQPGNLDPTA